MLDVTVADFQLAPHGKLYDRQTRPQQGEVGSRKAGENSVCHDIV
jgi:hypothetical protein